MPDFDIGERMGEARIPQLVHLRQGRGQANLTLPRVCGDKGYRG